MQAVIPASGLHSRAYRLPWPAGTMVYEVDQPQVIDFKNRTARQYAETLGVATPMTNHLFKLGRVVARTPQPVSDRFSPALRSFRQG